MAKSQDGSRIEAAEAAGHAEQREADGHGPDPDAGVLVGVPPTPAWVLTAAGIAAVTIAVCVALAVILAGKVG